MNSVSIRNRPRGFSLIEVLAAVAIIGIIVFLAIPNIIAMRTDSEDQIAISNAEALNIATSSFIQANGQANAGSLWDQAATDNAGNVRAIAGARYNLVKPYLAYSRTTLEDFEPRGFDYDFGSVTAKVTIFRAGTTTNPISY